VQAGPVTDYRVIRVHQDVLKDPRTGVDYPRVMIDAPDWVNVIAVTKADELVLVRQFRFGVWENTLEIPGGAVDPGEDPVAAGVRELEEETGFHPGEILALGSVHPNPALQNNRAFTVLCRGCVQVHDGKQESTEDIVVELHPRRAIPKMIRDGHITHSLTIAALYLESIAG